MALPDARRPDPRGEAARAHGRVAWLPGVSVFYAGEGFATRASRANVPGTYPGTDVVAAAGILGSTRRDERVVEAR